MTKDTKTKNKGGRPLKITPDTFRKVTDEYLTYCEEESKVPFLVDLAKKIGISKETMNDYGKRSPYDTYIKRVQLNTESALLHRGIESQKPVMSIFLLKSLFQYREELKLDVTSNGETMGVIALPTNPDNKGHK